MFAYLKKHPWVIFIIITLVFWGINHRIGNVYVGIDNISPFWGISPILEQIKHSENFFGFGPLLFAWWFYLLRVAGFSASLISTLYVYGYLFISLLGWYGLMNKMYPGKVGVFAYVFIFFGSLIPLWVFSTHELMFMSMFTAAPFIIQEFLRPPTENRSAAEIALFSVILVPMLFSSAVNIVVYGVGVILCTFLAILQTPMQAKNIIKKSLYLNVIFLLLLQAGILLTSNRVTVTTELYHHLVELNQSPIMSQLTTDLQRSELQNASITNALRFATGWLALFDEKTNYLLPWAHTFRNNIYLIIVQVFLLLTYIATNLKFEKKWGILLIVASMLLSTFGISLLLNIPVVGVLFRSASTKLWLLLWVPTLILGSLTVTRIFNKPLLAVALTTVLAFTAFPWYTGKLASGFSAHNIPKSYELFYSGLSAQSTVLVIPEPQTTYFRRYPWGYYGSSLVVYMTRAHILDGASAGKDTKRYKDLSKDPCKAEIDYLVIEKYQDFPIPNCITTTYELYAEKDYFTVYLRKQ